MFEQDISLDTCFLCLEAIGKFPITPAIELENGSIKNCCEECADLEFPGWQEDED